MKFLVIIGTCIAIMASADVSAQTTAAKTGAVSGQEKPKRFLVEAEVAPQWATATPFDYDEVTDATTVSLTLTAKPRIPDGINSKITMGPTAKLDSDQDDPDGASSGFGVGAEVTIDATQGFALFGSVGYKVAFTNLFEDDAGDERSFSTGLKYGHDFTKDLKGRPGMGVSASASYNLSDAADDTKDQQAAQVKAAFSTPIKWWARLDIEGTAARRWFRIIDPNAGFKQRRDEWAVSAGINFAPGINALLGGNDDNPWLRKFKIGYNYFERDSNIVGKDKTSSSPSLAIAIGQAF